MESTAETSQIPSFEESMERLESIVEEMEHGRLPLESLISRFDEGTRLTKICSERLDEAQRRIEIIMKNAEGRPAAAAFDPSSATAEEIVKTEAPTKPVKSTPAKSVEKHVVNPGEISLF